MDQIIRGGTILTTGDSFQLQTITPIRRDGYYLQVDRFEVLGNNEELGAQFHFGLSVAAPNRSGSFTDYEAFDRDIIGNAPYMNQLLLDSDKPGDYIRLVDDAVFASSLDIIMATRSGSATGVTQARMAFVLYLSDRKETAALRELYYSRSSGA